MKLTEHPDGATPLDHDESDGLKLKHITTREALDRWEFENISDAKIWVNNRRKKSVLTEEFIQSLHAKMYSKVWDWAGRFRKTDKNIGVKWVDVPVELRNLLRDVQYWIENKTYAPDEIAARYHHKLVWIHLFPNGNGRHARLITDLLLVEVLGEKPFTWGGRNLATIGQERSHYIEALKAADKNDYTLLLEFVRT